MIYHISKRQSNFAFLQRFYFHKASHQRSFVKIKPSRNFLNVQLYNSATFTTFHGSEQVSVDEQADLSLRLQTLKAGVCVAAHMRWCSTVN